MNLNDLTLEEITEFADTPAIFQKGQQCYGKGRVEQFFMSGKGIKAKVEGKTGPYSVEIRTGGGNLTTDCTCAYSGEVCEHIVAVLLYAMLGDPEEEEEAAAMVPAHGIPISENKFQQLFRGELYIEDLFELMAQSEPKSNVIPFPNSKKMTVAELKEEIQEFFESVQGEEEEPVNPGDYGFFDLDQLEVDLNSVFAQLKNLTLKEQIDVLWYVVTSGNLICSQTGTVVAEVDIAEALALFADRVIALDLEMPEKEVYLNSLIAAFDWPMFLNEELDTALKAAMTTLCSTEEELRYAIATLESCGLEENSREWVMEADRTLGDGEKLVRLAEGNLETVEDYLNLAHYWRETEQDFPRSIEILEQWIEDCTPQDWDNVRSWTNLYRVNSDNITILLEDLVNYYAGNQDPKNLYRLMMLWLRINGLSLEFYHDFKTVAQRLRCLDHCQEQIRMFARDEMDELIAIYFAEEDWERAIALAQKVELPLEIQVAIAQGVRESHPEEAIGLYDQLVHSFIQKKSRANYQKAAEYATLIRDIYRSVLNKPSQGQKYIDGLQQRYQRYRALQDELQKISGGG
ncbi:MAG: SWIM zinc finger family protein [Chroococcales cyanobacterium]